jgi:hypothetical protein
MSFENDMHSGLEKTRAVPSIVELYLAEFSAAIEDLNLQGQNANSDAFKMALNTIQSKLNHIVEQLTQI